MGQDKNFRPTIPADIDQPAPSAYALPPHVRGIPSSSLIDGVNGIREDDLASIRTPPSLRGMSDARLASHAFIILLKLGAKPVVNMIRAFWNLITRTLRKKEKRSPGSSPKDTRGVQKSFDVRLGNVVYFAPTATESILFNNRITTAIQTYEERCRKYMTLTKSAEEYDRIKDGLVDGTLDPETISFADWLHVSFLTLYHASEELHSEPKIVHKGNVFHLHVCVQGVVPAQQIEKLKNKV